MSEVQKASKLAHFYPAVNNAHRNMERYAL